MLSFQPCETTNTSVRPFCEAGVAIAASTAFNWSGLYASPSFVNSTRKYGYGPIVVGVGIENPLNRLNGAHQIDQARTLEILFAAQIGRGRHEDPLDLLRLTDVLASNRQKRGDRARHVRRGHTRAAV